MQKQKNVMLVFLLSVLMPLQRAVAYEQSADHTSGVQIQDAPRNQPEFVYLNEKVCQSIIELKNRLPHHQWSELFQNLCLDIVDEGNVALYEDVDYVVNECLAVCKYQQYEHSLRSIQVHLREYKEILDSGAAYVEFSGDELVDMQAKGKSKKICRLCVKCLSVNGSLFVNGVNYSDLAALAGAIGATGAAGLSGVLGYAEFTQTIQSPNQSVPIGQAFSFNTLVYNSIPSAIIPGPGPTSLGTAFQLAAGAYVIDYEMSLTSDGAIAVYIGPALGSMVVDNNTIAGAATGTTWIHGRAIEVVPTATTKFFMISSVGATSAVPIAGSSGLYMTRLTILKIA
jgi:hypothetical protein